MAARSTPFANIYLDNNATTEMPESVKQEMLFWSNRGNASAGYEAAEICRRMMSNVRQYVGALTGVGICCDEDRDSNAEQNAVMRADGGMFKVIFTSGASESNSAAITGAINAANKDRLPLAPLPNVAVSELEHKSVLNCVKSLAEQGRATITWIKPNRRGIITPAAVAAAIGPTTCLVSVMAANNETGAIADIAGIYDVCRERGVHYHCDAVQIFGKYRVAAKYCDSMSMSFHKLHGPPGVGLLILRQSAGFIPLIHGSQNEGLRGGTENIPGIAAGFAALRYTMDHRKEKNANLLAMKRYVFGELSRRFDTCTLAQYVEANLRNNAFEQSGYTIHDILPQVAARALVDAGLAAPKLQGVAIPKFLIVFISELEQCLPNTILLSIVRRTPPSICNSTIKDKLAEAGIIVSIGSACNTADPKASHVLYSLGADQYVRQGCLRISMGDSTTMAEMRKFIDVFSAIAAALRDM